MKDKKKQTKRERSKYPALDPTLNLKTRFELIDQDYIDKLSEKDKKWLNKFNEEYVNASLNTKEKKKNLHKTDELRKDCYNRNNARNRDILTRAKASGASVYLEDLSKKNSTNDNPESVLIRSEEVENLSEPGDDSNESS